MNKSNANSAELVLHEEENSAIDFQKSFYQIVNPLESQMVEQLVDSDILKFNQAKNYWTPTYLRESKRVIYQGNSIEKFPDRNDPSKLVEIEVANFVEVFRDEDGDVRQQMIMMGHKKILSYIKSVPPNGLPKHSALVIEYQGEKPSKKAGGKYHDFAFFLLIRTFND